MCCVFAVVGLAIVIDHWAHDNLFNDFKEQSRLNAESVWDVCPRKVFDSHENGSSGMFRGFCGVVVKDKKRSSKGLKAENSSKKFNKISGLLMTPPGIETFFPGAIHPVTRRRSHCVDERRGESPGTRSSEISNEQCWKKFHQRN